MFHHNQLFRLVLKPKTVSRSIQPSPLVDSQPMHRLPSLPLSSEIPRTPTQIRVGVNQFEEIPSEFSCRRRCWVVGLAILILLLVAIAITVTLLLNFTFPIATTVTTSTTTEIPITTTTLTVTPAAITATTSTITTSFTTSSTTTTFSTSSTTTTSSTSSTTTTSSTSSTTTIALPSECSSYTNNTDSTRYYTYTASNTGCDDPSPFGSSATWVRFSGGAGTRLADSSSIGTSDQCGTTNPGYYTVTYPGVGLTASGTVCYRHSGSNCWKSNTISVTNCNDFYVYNLTATLHCGARYCTM